VAGGAVVSAAGGAVVSVAGGAVVSVAGGAAVVSVVAEVVLEVAASAGGGGKLARVVGAQPASVRTGSAEKSASRATKA
jgi:hypothetical protein